MNTLVDIVTRVGSPAIGICVDPGNCVAALELPTATVEAVAQQGSVRLAGGDLLSGRNGDVRIGRFRTCRRERL
ncbi:MAG: hypothetical protein ABW022_02570 [Actinoplanes sp.]